MKKMTLALLAVLNIVTLHESAAFVWCDHDTLSFSEEVPEDGPDEVYRPLESLDNGSGNIPV